MASWNKKSGKVLDDNLSDEKIWEKIGFLYSSSSMKTNTYKFGFLKAILDNLFNGVNEKNGVFYPYYDLFEKFAENYWNLVVKYELKQMRPNGKSTLSSLEKILLGEIDKDKTKANLEFESLDNDTKKHLVNEIKNKCKKCVIGALYGDFDGTIYEFDLSDDGLYLSYQYYYFFVKHKIVIETLNYFYWAKFIEKYNDEKKTYKLLEKLELATPKRADLSSYLQILRDELGIDRCFYCGKELKRSVEVDHFIPWSFVRNDKMWNFVLACKKCNGKKSNYLVGGKYIKKIIEQNLKVAKLDNLTVMRDFYRYEPSLIEQLSDYARLSGFKDYNKKF